jgi:hypothetical protein
MKIRELTQTTPTTTRAVWPPAWAAFYGRSAGAPLGENGRLKSVRRITDPVRKKDHLLLIQNIRNTEYVAPLAWDGRPGTAAVEALLQGHLGETMRTIGELEV